MKKTIAILALAALLTVSACGNSNTPSDTTEPATTTAKADDGDNETTTESKSGEVTAIAFEAPERPDTTEAALEFLDKAAPAFKKYLDMRRSVPLTMESTVTSGGNEWKTNIYIKDSENFAQDSTDPNGYSLTIIYKKDKIYQVDHDKKAVYVYNCGEEEIADDFDSLSLRYIYEDDVKNCDYEAGEGEYNGTTYDFVNITEGGSVTTQYFDQDTGALVYTVDGDDVTYVSKFENSFTNDSILELPSDYEMKTITDLYNEQAAAAAEQQGGIDLSQ